MNIILISIDSLRADYLACYGNNKVKTPNLDYLAQNGIIFRNAIVQAPHTLTSHSSMLSGLYPFKHGLRKVQDLVSDANPDATMIFSQLENNGYNIVSLLGMGIETFSFALNSEWKKLNYCGFSTLKNVHNVISENHKKPFFMFLHYWDVHTPYSTYIPIGNRKEALINLAIYLDSIDIKAEWIDKALLDNWHHRVGRIRDMMLTGGKYVKTVKAGYRRSIEKMDKYIGEIISYLKKFSIFDDTLIIFTGDHGDSFNEHNERQETDLYEHGCYLWDYLLKVPLIMHYPNGLKPNDISQQVESVDIVPTIYDLTNITPINKDDLDGVSLNKLSETGQYSKAFAYSETEGSDLTCIRTSQYKFIKRLRSENDKQLYDIQKDPMETDNIFLDKTNIASKMENDLEKLLQGHPRFTVPQEIKLDGDVDLEEINKRLKSLGYM